MISKLRASLVHLCGSILLALFAVGLVYLLWYPPPMASALGVSGIFLIVLAVDVIVGPILTFIVYKVGKKTLRLDLTVIIALQLSAFCYGLGTIAIARPAWLVFNVDRFDVAQAHELDTRFAVETRPEFRQPPWTGPRWVASRRPSDPKRHNQLVMESAIGGPDLPQRPDLYLPLVDEVGSIKNKAHPLNELAQFNHKIEIDTILAKWPEANAWLPMMAKARPMTVLLNKNSGKIVAVVDLRPWN
ncbi:TfpX/TfpZ family type IV pilin accessory protein [Variovorax sp. CCNWLW225]|jgi:hypothetical protein|uniref:TfpX/TfpZ family type IV pilin accessory protein n=1 Tax=Variovorax sp. CCNWLW225 TaxID=3127462 RepID=UPI0030771819